MMENYKLISVNILTNFSRSGLSRLIFNYTLNSIYIEEFYEHTNMFDEEFQLIYYGTPKVCRLVRKHIQFAIQFTLFF